jgi:hypothetical protein
MALVMSLLNETKASKPAMSQARAKSGTPQKRGMGGFRKLRVNRTSQERNFGSLSKSVPVVVVGMPAVVDGRLVVTAGMLAPLA